MSVLPFGTYIVTLPWHGHGSGPIPPVEYSLLYDDDTEDGTPGFHTPGDWNIYSPLTYRQALSDTDIAGASSGPSLAAPLPPGIGLLPLKPKPPA